MPAHRGFRLFRAGSLIRTLLLTSLALFVAAVVNFMMDGPGRGGLLAVAVALPFLVGWLGFSADRDRIDVRLEELMGHMLGSYKVVSQDFPDYRFVDVFRAVEHRFRGPRTNTLDSVHHEELGNILKGSLMQGAGYPEEPPRIAKLIAPAEEAYFPMQRFWITTPNDRGKGSLVARLRSVDYLGVVRLEVAARNPALAERVVEQIRSQSARRSVYRGATLELAFAAGVKDEYGNVDQIGKVKVEFKQTRPVGAGEMVIDTRVWPLIEGSLVRFHSNHEQLRKLGVMLKRGFLFFGPPGTGKSFTCRYIASLLPGTTIVYCTGAGLHHVASAFNVARLLKPALIVMEDVDLVFSSRDINPHGSALGELFDQIDALADNEPICLVLTTNAIERVEEAVKDRPGRVSQCIYFGPPSAELRQHYLAAFLKDHETTELDLDRVIRDTDGASQAFLKELVHRALQIAVEAGRSTGSQVKPASIDFAVALEQMRSADGKAARAITGFRIAPS
jgi:hypothetical protein